MQVLNYFSYLYCITLLIYMDFFSITPLPASNSLCIGGGNDVAYNLLIYIELAFEFTDFHREIFWVHRPWPHVNKSDGSVVSLEFNLLLPMHPTVNTFDNMSRRCVFVRRTECIYNFMLARHIFRHCSEFLWPRTRPNWSAWLSYVS